MIILMRKKLVDSDRKFLFSLTIQEGIFLWSAVVFRGRIDLPNTTAPSPPDRSPRNATMEGATLETTDKEPPARKENPRPRHRQGRLQGMRGGGGGERAPFVSFTTPPPTTPAQHSLSTF